MRKQTRLTEEQNAMRLEGLRVLARLIVRAHLASLVEEDADGPERSGWENGPGHPASADGGLPLTEGGHGG